MMALLYHWPFGGWRSQYRGLATLYRANPEAAVAKYQRTTMRRRTASGIRL